MLGDVRAEYIGPLLVFADGNAPVAGSGRGDAHGARAHEFRCVGNDVIGQVARYRILVDGQRALAHRAAAVVRVRVIEGIGREVPQHHVAAPVAHDADYEPLDGRGDCDLPLSGTFGGHLFGEINLLVRTRFVDVAHGAQVAAVVMESSSRDIFCGLRVVVNSQCVVRPVAVVVEDYDAGRQPCFPEFGAQIIFDEIGLFKGKPVHTGGVARVEGFVLHGNGVDVDPVIAHRFHITYEIVGIDSVTLLAKLPAAHVGIGFHPCRRRPGRGKYLDVGVDGQDLPHDRNHVVEVLCQ